MLGREQALVEPKEVSLLRPSVKKDTLLRDLSSKIGPKQEDQMSRVDLKAHSDI